VSAATAGEIRCQEVVELVTDHLEGRLSAGRRARLELHLRSCPGCRAYLAQVRALVRAAGRLPAEELPPALRQELLAAFRGRGW